MGMGGSGGGRGEVTSDINVTPMADVMLVLLIIFMVITPMLQKGVSVELARTKNPIDMKEADRDDAVLVAVTRDGKIYLGQNKVNIDELASRVNDLLATKLEKKVSRATFARSTATSFRLSTTSATPVLIRLACSQSAWMIRSAGRRHQ